MNDLIRVADMLEIMQMRSDDGNLIPFSITFVTANKKEGTGGQRISYEAAVLYGFAKSNSTIRNPAHHANYTRNLVGVGTNEIRKFHPLLVEYFNGKTVIL
ncbi:hypothetical protein [Mucilaginibacter sp. CSA2-8R]|uniref:hypothetical protein n=1 Tax=Mucilaginibacter sp. CSA2-8R TaxID=3141542 RepID=UPI00315C9BB3